VLLAGPADRLEPAAPWLARRAADGRVIMVGAAESPSRSARGLLEAALARGHSGVVMTTGDHPLLTPATLASFIRDALATDADAIAGLAHHHAVRTAFPDSRRTALRFADGARCGCNLFLFRGTPALQVLDFWQRVEGFRKQPHRILGMLGAGLAVRYAAGRLTLDAALERLSRITGARVSAVEVADPDAAVDVDNLADLATVRARWAQRSGPDGHDQPRGNSKQ
jgi:Arc/MetJ family transcription regulator